MHEHKHTVPFTVYSTIPFYILSVTDILTTSENISDDQHAITSTKITRHIPSSGSGRQVLWYLKPLEVHMLRGIHWGPRWQLNNGYNWDKLYVISTWWPLY